MKNIGINANSDKAEHGKVVKHIEELIKKCNPKANVKVFKDSIGLNTEETKDLEVVITLGGDGTILSTARELAKFHVPILGVNLGNLGFLAAVESGGFEKAIANLMEGKYKIESRMMLKSTVVSKDYTKEYHSLNDVIISKSSMGRIIKYTINIDKHFYTNFNADGIIISTATGSTAYSLSSGGPIIYPSLQVMSITPICAQSLGMRTIVLDGNSEVEVSINSNNNDKKVLVAIDGQELTNICSTDKVIITKSEYKCNLIMLDDNDYFEILRKKIILRTKECEGGK